KLFKTITMIYGDPNAVHSQDCIEPFMQVIDVLQFDIDKCLNDVIILNLNDKIELDTVDELLHSSDSIIHQSPFNIEMRKQVPMMNDILDKRKKFENISNPNFSKPVMSLFYKWFAYLPLWTCLLSDFEDR
ncbi:unnamed protein product, partial [Didymodactylos carnosus]